MDTADWRFLTVWKSGWICGCKKLNPAARGIGGAFSVLIKIYIKEEENADDRHNH